MNPSRKRLLLSLGGSAALLMSLYALGDALWGLIALLTWRPPEGSGGLATVSVGIGGIPVGLVCLVLALFCLRALRRVPRPPRS